MQAAGTHNRTADAIIIGGGIIGLSIARELKKNGVERVLLLEKNFACGTEASFAAAGMLAPQAETNKADAFFDLCRQSRDLYPNFAAELLEETGIDVELDQTGTLYLAFDEEDLEEIEQRFEWQRKADLPVEKLNEWDIAALEPNVSKLAVGGLRFPLDWQVENTKITEALGKLLEKNEEGGFQSINTADFLCGEVRSLIFENDKVSGVETELGRIYAGVVIIASGAWTSLIGFPESFAHTIKIMPVRGQMLSFADNDKLFRHVVYSPHGYIVPRRDNRVLIGATVENAGFENRTTGAGVASLLETAFEISPQFQNLSIKKIWSGLRPKSLDGLPLLGEFPENSGLYFATGHYRNGILLAPLTGKLIAEKIVNNVNSSFFKIFNPSRFQR